MSNFVCNICHANFPAQGVHSINAQNLKLYHGYNKLKTWYMFGVTKCTKTQVTQPFSNLNYNTFFCRSECITLRAFIQSLNQEVGIIFTTTASNLHSSLSVIKCLTKLFTQVKEFQMMRLIQGQTLTLLVHLIYIYHGLDTLSINHGL